MTETTADPTPEADEQEPAAAADEATAPADDASDEEGGDREAARYRRRLRSAERERDAALGKLEELHEKHVSYVLDVEIKRAATGKLADPDDLLVFTPREQLLGEDGMPSAERIVEAVDALTMRRPHLRAQVVPSFDAGARPQPSSSSSGAWSELLRGR